MQLEDRVRVLHMIEAAQTALEFASGRERTDLDTDRMLLFALVRAIEIIGEAAGQISKPARSRAPDIPWPLIVSMRNRLIHAYFDVDHDILWNTVTIELPELLPRLQALKTAIEAGAGVVSTQSTTDEPDRGRVDGTAEPIGEV